MRTNGYLLSWALVVALMGCDKETAETNVAESTPSRAASAEEAPQQPRAESRNEAPVASVGPRAEEESYVLEARPEAGGYHAGNLGQFAIHLTSRGEWHLNQDFPFSVELEGPADVSFPKATLGKGDAAEFEDEAARVDVPFTPSAAGEHEVRARVAFAVCSATSCVPKTATLALNLRVD